MENVFGEFETTIFVFGIAETHIFMLMTATAIRIDSHSNGSELHNFGFIKLRTCT